MLQLGNARPDQRRVNGVRPLAHQAHDHCAVAAVAYAGGRQRTIKLHFDAAYALQLVALAQALHKQRRRPHRAYGVGAGRADTDLEQVKHADSHEHEPRG